MYSSLGTQTYSLQRIEAYFQHFTFENKVKETFLLEKIGDNN
ncbi:hypothetical protein [Chryseobacterium potabilaquae]|nr:hypothetical protein [Chryseobacterium potabilaquae]